MKFVISSVIIWCKRIRNVRITATIFLSDFDKLRKATVIISNIYAVNSCISHDKSRIKVYHSHAGQVGDTQTVETGYAAARVCALNALANIKAAVGSLDQVVRLVYVTGFVNAISGFADSPAVINGASDLFVAVFGEKGKHARAAVAVAGLPKNSTVEIQVVVEVRV